MPQFSNIKKEELHHAYLIEGDSEGTLNELYNFLENELKFSIKGNPDFWCGEFDTFSIDDGRTIRQMQSRKGIVGEQKIFIISANFFTREAQNSLLKVFEEPTEGTHFFVITQNTNTLLPTLRSRMFELFTQRQDLCKDKGLHFAEEFLGVNGAVRIKMLKDIIEDKDRDVAIQFLNNLESVLHKKVGHAMSDQDVFTLEEIIKCKKYLNSRSPSVKMILEHIVLTVPRVA